jgi:hypothetical protein
MTRGITECLNIWRTTTAQERNTDVIDVLYPRNLKSPCG